MAMLHRNREVSFNRIRDTLGLSDGNLGSHAQRLIDAGYITSRHGLAGARFELRYRITEAGRAALRTYIEELQDLLGDGQAPG